MSRCDNGGHIVDCDAHAAHCFVPKLVGVMAYVPVHPCNDSERALIVAATRVLREKRRAEKNTECAGVLGSDGRQFVGLDLVSQMSSVCAEPAAIAAAHLAGVYEIASIVAVCFTPSPADIVVLSPCGACRERIRCHAPTARVLIADTDGPAAVVAEHLFAIWAPVRRRRVTLR